MKNKLILVVLFMISGFWMALAQTKSIEVMVKDTIRLQPIGYEFEVSSGLTFTYDHENPNAEEEFSAQLRQSEEAIVALLKKWEYEFELSGNPDASFTREPRDKRNYRVQIKDSVDKEQFTTRMKKEGINFYMSNITYEDAEPKINEMYTRLLKKARERAELIASLSNRKVGELLEISESKSEFSLLSSFIESFAYSFSHHGSSASFRFNPGVFEKSILVKYAMD